ncbi:DUF6884 domain-containing protein [Streptomyces sp. NPDC003444]
MSKIDVYFPAQLRKHVAKNLIVQNEAQQALKGACIIASGQVSNPNSSTTIQLTNEALGVALELAREWLGSKNGNNNMAARSLLSKHEMDYKPTSLSEVRYGVKMPKSLSGEVFSRGKGWKGKDVDAEMGQQLKYCSWSVSGMSGRVGHDALGWLLTEVRDLMRTSTSGAIPRAADKFLSTYEPQYREQAEKWAAPAVSRPRLVVIACGNKKSSAPDRIPAEERYTGNYFRACLMASEVMDGSVRILSAKYGLISPREEIENYDATWGGKGSIRLGTVRKQVEEMGLENAQVTVLGGERYVKAARQIWPDAEAPLKGGIGQQLRQLAGIYEGEALEEDQGDVFKSDKPDLPQGVHISLTSDSPETYGVFCSRHGGADVLISEHEDMGHALAGANYHGLDHPEVVLIEDDELEELRKISLSNAQHTILVAARRGKLIEDPRGFYLDDGWTQGTPVSRTRAADLVLAGWFCRRTEGGRRYFTLTQARRQLFDRWSEAQHQGLIDYAEEDVLTSTKTQREEYPPIGGEHEAYLKKTRPGQYYEGSLHNLSGLPSRGRPSSPCHIWFGGKAGKANPKPKEWRRAGVTYLGEGRYEIYDLDTSEVLLTCALRSRIYYASADWKGDSPAQVEDRGREEEPAEELASGPKRFTAPENWVELAEDGNTEQARAYWRRRCEEYERTGR